MYEMGAGTTVETAIPTDADYKKIGNKLVRAFVMSLFAGINETPVADPSVGSSVDSRSGASRLTPVNMGWIEVCGYNLLFWGVKHAKKMTCCAHLSYFLFSAKVLRGTVGGGGGGGGNKLQSVPCLI